MKKSKDKQIRELKGEIIVLIIAVVLLVIFLLLSIDSRVKVEQQLQSCQDNATKATKDDSFHYKLNAWLNSFPENMTQFKCGLYVGSEEQMSRYFKIENCEVIE